MSRRPPRNAERILSRCVAPPVREAAMGDFHQMYAHLAKTDGRLAADAWYWRQALRSLPHLLSDSVSWSLLMFSNYFRVAYRNLLKSKASSIMNIAGMSIAVATVVFVFFFIEAETTRDRFHTGGDTIFQVMTEVDRGNGVQLHGQSPIPLAAAMEAGIPQVERAARISFGSATATSNGNSFEEWLWYADPVVMDMLSFPMRLGDPTRLREADSIVLSHAMAEKFFGASNPIGSPVTLRFSDERESTFTVVAVAAPFPSKASFQFNAIVPYSYRNADPLRWDVRTQATFVQLTGTDDVDAVAAQMEPFKALQNAVDEDLPVASFRFVNLYDMATTASNVNGSLAGGSPLAARIVFGVLALFMLLLSCLNYVNIALATATRRLREIAVRKTMGGTRGQIILQFLAENTLVCTLSLGVGVLVAYAWFVPGFNAMFAQGGGGITPADANTGSLWIFLVGLLFVTAIASGAYPAFYISRFSPIAIFRGRTTLGGENSLTYTFLTFQFVLAFLTMITGVVMTQNAAYQADRDWGYAAEQKIIVPLREAGMYDELAGAVERVPGVEHVVGAQHNFWSSWNTTTVSDGEDKMGVVRFDVGPGFVDLYELELIAGEGFTEGSNTDVDGAVMVNELFAARSGWTPEGAIGQEVRQDSLVLTVSGVVANVQYDDFYSPMEPMIIAQTPDREFSYMTIQAAAGAAAATNEAVAAVWKELMPGREYRAFFQDGVFDRIYLENRNIRSLFSFVALLALVISCMGLFGLVSQKVIRRKREISIRKVLGASLGSLAGELNRTFILIIAIAGVIAAPLGYVAMTALLGSIFADPMPVGPAGFLASLFIVLGTAFLTIASQFRRIANTNPAVELRGD